MSTASVISKTDLARRTRQVVDQARRGRIVIVESYGQDQVVILDIQDYRLLRAVAAYHARPARGSAGDISPASAGLDRLDLEQAEPQAVWEQVIAAYLDAEISLGRAAALLGLSRFELAERFTRLGLPLALGATDAEDARSERTALRR